MHRNARISLRLVPKSEPFVSAPPVLIASTHTIDYVCGKCATVLMHAEEGQVHNLVINCTICKSYNSTDAKSAQGDDHAQGP